MLPVYLGSGLKWAGTAQLKPMSDKSSLPFLGLTSELGQLLKVVPHLHEGVNGQEELRQGKLMHWNASSHEDMLPWLSLCKNVSL